MNMAKGGESGVIKIEVRDKDGRVIVKRTEKMNSFVSNYRNLVHTGLIMGATTGVKDTAGNNIDTVDDIKFSSGGVNAPANDDNYGIVVGSGTTSVSIDDYNLAQKIPNGTGSGQLQYQECTTVESGSGTTMTLEIKRSFINNSGGDITVNEVGVVIKLADSSGNLIGYVLICRDVVTATTVPNGGTLNVTVNLNINPS